MNENDPQDNAGEAQETVDRLESARSTANITPRLPKRLNALSSLLFGVFTMAASLQSGSFGWTAVLLLSALAFISIYVYWVRQSQILGATMRFVPSTFASLLLYLGQGVFFSVVIIGSQALNGTGAAWAPYAAAIVNGAVFSYVMHNYPTAEWGTRAAAK